MIGAVEDSRQHLKAEHAVQASSTDDIRNSL